MKLSDLSSTQRTKIICTLGPATASPEAICRLVLAGADCFRINLSHGVQEDHAEAISRVREVSHELKTATALLLDLRGAKIRTTTSHPIPFQLREGEEVEITGGEEPSTERRLYITPANALENLKEGNRILIDDAKIEILALSLAGNVWRCRVETGGIVDDRRGVTLVDVSTRQLPGLTEKDRSDIEFGIRQGVDLFALSFVRSADDIAAARRVISGFRAETPIIAKLEKPEGLAHLDEILHQCFGVMVARGDLGVEAPLEKVPIFQKQIIAAARRQKKPVIIATQMLESMIEKPIPTRAEVSDVANAVFDGADAVMLSAETSIGKFPAESVRMMARTIAEAEGGLLRERKTRSFTATQATFPDALGAAACVAAESVGARCILVYTASGYSAELISSYRPAMPIYAFSDRETVVRRLAVFWGLNARRLEKTPTSVEELIQSCEAALLGARLIEPKDTIVIVAGLPFHKSGNTNMLKLHRIGEYGPA